MIGTASCFAPARPRRYGAMPAPALCEHFRRIAPRYGRVRSLDVRAVRRSARAVARIAPGRGALRLLDVGTGTGRYLRAVCAELRARDVALAHGIGVDASVAMLAGGAPETTDWGGGPVAVAALADALPFASRACDVVLTFNAIH